MRAVCGRTRGTPARVKVKNLFFESNPTKPSSFPHISEHSNGVIAAINDSNHRLVVGPHGKFLPPGRDSHCLRLTSHDTTLTNIAKDTLNAAGWHCEVSTGRAWFKFGENSRNSGL